jgi:hypothetical protein
MRLLNVHSGRLEQFYGSQIPPYAILSHTWGSTEITFSDIQAETPTTLSSSSSPFPPVVSNFSDIETQAPWSPNPKNLRMRPKFSNTEAQSPSETFEFPFEPLPPILPASSLASDIESRPEYSKIRYTRNQAIADRLDYVWVDTCCSIQTHQRNLCPTKRVAYAAEDGGRTYMAFEYKVVLFSYSII